MAKAVKRAMGVALVSLLASCSDAIPPQGPTAEGLYFSGIVSGSLAAATVTRLTALAEVDQTCWVKLTTP